jgi:hypothetical protein
MCRRAVDFMTREQPRYRAIATSRQRHQRTPYCLQQGDAIVDGNPSLLCQFEDHQVAPAVPDRLHPTGAQMLSIPWD